MSSSQQYDNDTLSAPPYSPSEREAQITAASLDEPLKEDFTRNTTSNDAAQAPSNVSKEEPSPPNESAILPALEQQANVTEQPRLIKRLRAKLQHRPVTCEASATEPLKDGAAVLQRQAKAAALEDLRLCKSLGLKRSEVMLSSLRQHMTWALFSFGSLSLSFMCLAALIALSQRPALQPYVVTVDRQGVVLNRGPLPPASEALTPSLVAAELSDFVRHVRMVTPDKNMQRELMTRAYAMVAPGSKVFNELDAYYSAHNPLSTRGPYAVSVDILNVIVTGADTWQIDWREFTKANAAEPDNAHAALQQATSENSNARTMRALISFKQDTSLLSGQVAGSERLLLLNPLGLVITEFIVSDVIV